MKLSISIALTLIATSVVATNAAKLRLTLQPALDYHGLSKDPDNKLHFQVVGSEDYACHCTVWDSCDAVCGGTFNVDFSLYDAVVVTYEAPNDEREIQWSPTTNNTPGVLHAWFQAQAENCTEGTFGFLKRVKSQKFRVFGSNPQPIKNHFDQAGSYFAVSNCSIGTRIQVRYPMTNFTGTFSKVQYSVLLTDTAFKTFEPKTYSFTVDQAYIETNYEQALASTDAPTQSPTKNPTAVPTQAPVTAAPVVTDPPIVVAITETPSTSVPNMAPTTPSGGACYGAVLWKLFLVAVLFSAF